ncbi:hypothetical protein [Vandammella animalimorsus]|uniref:hypothetical protein n=1 Tax=Vandammella animalimorsus TaxID=2029117 RepID=UPI0011C3DC33|nr:hypothetical protein [Vandammella animalimorsus]
MSNLRFEKVGDVDSEYPYLCVYLKDDEINPFMEISINDAGVPGFVFYKNKKDVMLSFEDLSEIFECAKVFWSKETENYKEMKQ